MNSNLKILFIFIDGFGIGTEDPERNPLCNPAYPFLQQLINNSIPVDACLGVEGKPQSATGQTTLLTGINASKVMGRHVEGFPSHPLRTLIKEENIFSKLLKIGKKPTFANSYWIEDPYKIPLRRQSVTTVMTLHALQGVRQRKELLSGMAVNHDITRWTMNERGYKGPTITPEQAADHLLAIAEEHDFTLFEYFLTDRAGHARLSEQVDDCLRMLERFLSRTTTFGEQPNQLFLLCSDHGNIEDTTASSHTKNPVPLVAIGHGSESFQSAKSLTDITPTILGLFNT